MTRHKLNEIQKEFTQRMQAVKAKIKTFKDNVENCEDYELQLKLEYEIRLDINKLYSLKHSHESEFSGLEKRLEELEAFNTSTDLVHSLLNNQLIQFFEKCEDKILLQVRDAALIRLSEILSLKLSDFTISTGDEACEQIEKLYNIKVGSPIIDEQFKRFLMDNLLAGTFI